MNRGRLVRKLKRGWFTLEELKCSHAEIMALKQMGFRLSQRNSSGKRYYGILGANEVVSFVVDTKKANPTTYRWLEMSDIHAGSNEFDEQGLRFVLDYAIDQGIDDVHIAGDLCDGYKVYPGHHTNLRFFKAEEQAEELAGVLSEYDFRYIAIHGNHDESFEKLGSPNPVYLLAQMVDNFHYLESYAADLLIGSVVKRLVHGKTGGGANLSGPGQSYVRKLIAGQGVNTSIHGRDYRLRFIQFGHWHTVISYQQAGIWVTHSGNFQDINDFTMRQGLVGPTGARIVETTIHKEKVLEFTTTFIKPKR